jgi:hypothetical protein
MLRNLDPLAVAAWPAPRTNHGLFRAMGKEHHRHFRFVSRTNVAVLGLTHVPIISPFEKVPRNDRAFAPLDRRGVGPVMLSERSRERRRLAAECFALAQEAPDSNLRAHLLEMAQKWLELAELARPQDEKDAICLRAIQKKIGKQLRVHYGLPRELTHRILCLLMQLDAPEDGAHDAATRNGQDGER